MKKSAKFISLLLLAVGGLSFSKSTQAQSGGGWQYCSGENQYCNVSGLYDLAFGIGNSFVYELNKNTGSFPCRASTFHDRDPASGVVKECWVRPIATSPGGPGSGGGPGGTPPGRGGGWGPRWVDCASEGQVCTVYRPTIVRYGANGRYVQMRTRSAVECSNRNFGSDPAPGIVKRCQFQDR